MTIFYVKREDLKIVKRHRTMDDVPNYCPNCEIVMKPRDIKCEKCGANLGYTFPVQKRPKINNDLPETREFQAWVNRRKR